MRLCSNGHELGKPGRCLECKKIANKRWRDENKAHINAYIAKNKEKLSAGRKARYAKNPDKYIEKSRIWSANNRQRVLEKDRKYRAENPEKIARLRAKYIAQKTLNGGHPSKDIRQRLYFYQRGLCPCCGEPLGDDFHLDHKIPVSRGGSSADENMQLLRSTCNIKKGNRQP